MGNFFINLNLLTMKKQIQSYTLILIMLGFGLFTTINTGCNKSSDNKDGSVTLPILTTSDVTNINSTTASCGGDITSDGGGTITARGVCWNTSGNPTIADNKTSDGTGSGSFSSNLTGLIPATPYFARAYATNSAGTGYGNASTFTTLEIGPGTVLDVDGNVYHTVKIGTQEWLVENLKVTHYRNGDTITHANSMTKMTIERGQGTYWNYNNKDSLGNIYGHLYNFYALTDPRFLAPLGWRVASDSDWTVLSTYLGGDSISGGKMKETGTTHWKSPNIGATNESGFTVLPGGNYNSVTGFFSFLGYGTSIWTSTENDANDAYACALYNNTVAFYHGPGIPKFGGLSVRCVKGDR
jgi:uncharacterized protein (TIGR02145 family)